MKINVGDKVIIDKDKLYINWQTHPGTVRKEPFFPMWYSDDIFTVVDILENEKIILDKELPNSSGNRIHISYLKLLRTDRKKKLLKLNLLNIY